ncbi:MAG TPA: IclR family transcriptional regulator [Ramlibacter sp.]|nr:IclR family transcriptional regulator [Ramlibacter sp.]
MKSSEEAKPEEKKDRQYVTALARGLDVLRCFDAARPSLSTAEIARLTGLPQPTVWRLCHTLIQEGYLARSDRKDKLRPGIPVLSLGYAAIAATPIAELARADMQEIATRHQGAVSLGTRDGDGMIYLQRCQGSQIILKDMRVGSRVPLLSSATGWAYIAGLREAERKVLFNELRRSDPKMFEKFIPEITHALEGYAQTGYVVNMGSFHAQINSIAVPVASQDGSVLLSLSSGGIHELFNARKLKAVGADLKKLAVQLSAALTAQKTVV